MKLKTKQEIKVWLDAHKIKNYTVTNDLVVHVNGNVDLSREQFNAFPVKFGEVKGRFWAAECHLTTLEGAPYLVEDFFTIGGCWKLQSLKGLPGTIGTSLFTYGCVKIPKGVLPFLKIKELACINTGNFKVDQILNGYLPNPSAARILMCQTELLDKGFEEHAVF